MAFLQAIRSDWRRETEIKPESDRHGPVGITGEASRLQLPHADTGVVVWFQRGSELFRQDVDCAAMTPLLAMHSLGHDWVPPSLHAGGLRYHGMAPLVSQSVVAGLMQPMSVPQIECFDAAITWARSEGFIPAPETSHALAVVVRTALQAKAEGR